MKRPLGLLVTVLLLLTLLGCSAFSKPRSKAEAPAAPEPAAAAPAAPAAVAAAKPAKPSAQEKAAERQTRRREYMAQCRQDMLAELDAEVEQGRIAIVELDEAAIKVVIGNEAAFATGSPTLKKSAASSLQGLAAVLTRCDQLLLQVAGYTDSAGDPDYNLALSQRRAEAVAARLSKHGVSEDRMAVLGLGAKQPRADNATADGRRANRRVELVLSYPF